MKACLLKGPSQVCMEEVSKPKLGTGDVLIRFKAGGICGTDLEKIHGGYGPGGILGHEVSGTIEEVGSHVQGLNPGDRVVPHHHVACYKCQLCQRGDYTMCDFFKKTNFDPCGFAELFRVPDFNVSKGAVVKLPDVVSFEEAALIEPAACCLRALNTAHMQPDTSVLIVGLGPTGLTQLQLLKEMHSGPLFGSDILQTRLDAAQKMGAKRILNPTHNDVATAIKETTGVGVDLAIVSTGNPKALSQAISSVRKGGTILLFGAPAQGSTFPLDISDLFTRQRSIITSYSCTESEIQHVLRLVVEKKLDLSSLITHKFPLSKAKEALEFAGKTTNALKTVIHE